MARRFAIIGSGPAGLYAAERLLRGDPAASLDIFDKLPVPFGLIRYGVSPDHQPTKAVSRMLSRVFEKPAVRFLGGVEIGRDVSVEALRQAYDGVLFAVGCGRDRRLGIPGENLPGVIPSGAFVDWINDHPDGQPVIDRAVRDVVIIGAGNVALDVARVLAKSAEEMAGSDLAPATGAAIWGWPLARITLAARRGPDATKFTPVELDLMGKLARMRIELDPPALPPDETPVLRIFRGFERKPDAPITLAFRFGLTPVAFAGEGVLRSVSFQSAAGPVSIPADLAVTCIGHEIVPIPGLACVGGVIANTDGVIDERLYVVGWAAKGASGTIPGSRHEAMRMADRMLAEAKDGGRGGIQPPVGVFTWKDWLAIDEAERRRAPAGRVRHKLSRAEMMQIRSS